MLLELEVRPVLSQSKRERTLASDELRYEIGEHVERGARVAVPKTNIASAVAAARSAQPSRTKGILVAARCLFGCVVLVDWNHNEKSFERAEQHLVRHLFSSHPSATLISNHNKRMSRRADQKSTRRKSKPKSRETAKRRRKRRLESADFSRMRRTERMKDLEFFE